MFVNFCIYNTYCAECLVVFQHHVVNYDLRRPLPNKGVVYNMQHTRTYTANMHVGLEVERQVLT